MYKFCLLIFSVLLIPVALIYPYSIGGYFSESLLVFTLIMVALALILFVFSTLMDPVKELRKQYIRPIYMFLLGYIIVFFQAYLDLLLGNLGTNNYFFFVSPSLINQGALLSCIGLITLFIGYLTGRKKIKENLRYERLVYLPIKPLIYIFSLLTALNLALNAQQMLTGEYSQEALESSAGTSGAYVQLFFYVIYLSVITIHAINCRVSGVNSIWLFIKKLGLIFYINLSLYLLLVMISGDRGPILTIVLTLLGAIIIGTQTKIKFATIVFAIFLGATFISLLGVIRNMDTRISFEDRMSQAIEDESVDNRYKSVLPATAELSTSVRTLHFALEQVPARHDYFLGIFQVREALKVIPFAAGIFDPLFPAHFSYKNSAYFITWIDKGENYRSGAGSSINADLYLSFGEIGVVIFLFLLGRLFRRIDLFVFSEYGKHINVLQVVLMVSILGSSIYWSRASLLTPIQSIALTYILVIMYRKIVLKQTS